MPDPFQLSAQINAPSVQDFSALQSKMDALRSGVQPMQGAAQVDDGWGAVDQSLGITPQLSGGVNEQSPKMPVLPSVNQSAPKGLVMYNFNGGYNPATDWSINGVMSPEETARRFKRYMTDNNATSDQAKAYFEDQALRAEARHIYNANQRLLREGRPPVNSFDRQKFVEAHRKAYNY